MASISHVWQVSMLIHKRLESSTLIFISVHVSPCGEHLAILGPQGRLLIIPYFERVIDRHVEDITDIMIDIQLNLSYSNSESIYLAYEHGRIAVVTVRLFHPLNPIASVIDLCVLI